MLTDRPVELWITCRMTHVFALEVLRGGAEGSTELAEHGIAALTGPLHDTEHGGWFAAVDGGGPVESTKQAYGHAFVVLAAASATAAGTPGAAALLAEALDVLDRRFWDEAHGMSVEEWDREWRHLEPYRGVNANMHLVEALLAAHDVTGDAELLDRARRVTTRVVHGLGAGHGFRLPEHFTDTWEPVPDFNRDDPAHPFRPYGVTIGHLLEWSRLTLLLGRALGAAAPSWVVGDARSLFERAVADGWSDGEHPGFCYTTDFEGRPVVTHRMHWVVAEAVAAASVLAQDTGEPSYDVWRDAWLDARAHPFRRPRRRFLVARGGRDEPAVGGGLAGQARRLPRLPGAAHAPAPADVVVRRERARGSGAVGPHRRCARSDHRLGRVPADLHRHWFPPVKLVVNAPDGVGAGERRYFGAASPAVLLPMVARQRCQSVEVVVTVTSAQ